ncbi:MAG: phosphoenolpyruvate--protein phosphotransferase [Candidatus Desulfofervidaceae bacterium]|nr:phosphoenolpyruvate--protein phosphotransferase [Candidatus Desulfofervidaceae bacterium]
MEVRFKGIGVSPGIGIGEATVLEDKKPRLVYQFLLNDSEINKEVARFKKAIEEVKKEFKQLKKDLGHRAPFKEVKQILDTYMGILSDPMLFKATINRIKEEKINAEWALIRSLEEIEKIFSEIEDEYLKQRVQDVHYVVNRILAFLHKKTETNTQLSPGSIIIARDLSPAETIQLPSKLIAAFVTETGGRTSHTAIVAQALKLPAVVGVENISQKVKPGDLVIVDGLSGEVIIAPDPETLQLYKKRQEKYLRYCKEVEHYAYLPAQTLDGHKLKVMANVELFEEIPSVLERGAEGIGLFRTEFFYLQQKTLPDEELLYEYFSKVVKAISPYPVTFRTLDLGGDKFSSQLDFGKEVNPALGLRAIRFCLKQKDVFRTQLRAILRSSIHGKVRLLLPLISSFEEIIETKEFLETLKAELTREGYAFSSHIPIGVMIEVPSAVTLIDFMAQEADFLSIGTNDLIQYTLAIDRNNEHVAYLYEPLHPAVLKMIKQVVEVGHKAGIPVSVCGEMAGDPCYIPVLVGLGVDEMSLNAQNIPVVKKVLRSFNFKEAQMLAEKIVGMGTIQEIKEYYFNALKQWFKDILVISGRERIEVGYEREHQKDCLHE